MSGKFYAIRQPSPPRVVNSWTECEALVRGVRGALYKAFGRYEDALAWAENREEASESGLRVYVDGSFQPDVPVAGWAWVAVENGMEIACESGVTESAAQSRNIDGELEAAYRALLWFSGRRSQGDGQTMTLCHDYEGVGRWARGEWKAQSEVARLYVRRISGLLDGVTFEKVSAHSGLKWNDRADLLAKEALRALVRKNPEVSA